MKKLLFFGFIMGFSSHFIKIHAQVIEKSVPYPEKITQFAVGVQGTYNGFSYPSTLGGGLDLKLMINAQKNADAFNQYVFMVRGAHTIPLDGPLWGSFDDGKYNNVSAIILMAGYRFNFGAPYYIHRNFQRETGGWFLEFEAGGAHYRYSKTKLRPVVSAAMGYAATPYLDLLGSYTYSGTWLTSERKFPLAVFGLGAQVKF